MKFSEYEARRQMTDDSGQTKRQIPPSPPPLKKGEAQGQGDREFYVKMLASKQCLCERPKERNNSFCYVCYKALPEEMQRALYRSLGRGYEQAFDAAVVWLQRNVWE